MSSAKENRPCWLYFDLEFSKESNPDLDQDTVMAAFRQALSWPPAAARKRPPLRPLASGRQGPFKSLFCFKAILDEMLR